MGVGLVNPDELADLEEQRDFLVRSLDDLERELGAGDIDALDAATLRDDYRRRLDDVRTAIATGEAALLHRPRPRRRGRLALTVGLVALLAVGAGVAVAQTSGSRRPGDTATGSIRERSSDRLDRAAALQADGDFLEALQEYDAVLEEDPRNDEALAERGFLLLRLSIGSDEAMLVEDGRAYIERALAIAPDDPRWLFYRAVGLRFAGQDDAASAAFDAALAADPSPALRRSIEDFRRSIGA